ncbi:PilX N-terminal domain-containing pilus assembly protein [Marinimicrobium sp. ABcell2]|uniref:pilus assembly PilX family protein n=1 Tax=Marinimicrobium sp. ABcell2 TaxID=3069751 RepID=UPI0027B5080A|nr:PilX N-terminal domain-containing pilus assembly protein [Marinimicrobium sp. ABcell2]MDQ2078122.1 PilX N-terminal domain-containing pilus assembly protein [Marinimicrobium sp. ABcell2]
MGRLALNFKGHFKQRDSQRGVVLIVGLIMVLLISLVALAAIRGSSLQELMAGNVRDRNLAFQAAEAALREAEMYFNQATLPQFNGSTAGLIEAIPSSVRTGYWDNYNWATQSVQSTLDIERVSQPPRYVIEEVTYSVMAGVDGGAIDFENSLNTEDAVLYRITSIGYGATQESTVILQTTFKR